MPQNMTLDFGVLIAYAVPGALALGGLASSSPPLRALLARAYSSESTIGPTTLLLIASVVVGMILDVLRASWLELSFKIDLQKLRFPALKHAHFGRAKRADPCYTKLATKERLGAYLEAKARDWRPYQFYGNTLLAILIFFPGLVKAELVPDPINNLSGLLLAVVTLFVLGTLYVAARVSFYRFMSTVVDFNALGQPSETTLDSPSV